MELFKHLLYKKRCLANFLLIASLIFPAFSTAQVQDSCLPLEYRISAYQGTFQADRLNVRVELQFYNPNDVNVTQHVPTENSLTYLTVTAKLANTGLTIENNASGFPLNRGEFWKFSPGVYTESVAFYIQVVDAQNVVVSPFPDGNYTIAHLYPQFIPGSPATLEVKSTEVIVHISEVTWDFGKQGTATEVDIPANYDSSNRFICDTTSQTNTSQTNDTSSMDNILFSPLFIILFFSLLVILIVIIALLYVRKRGSIFRRIFRRE